MDKSPQNEDRLTRWKRFLSKFPDPFRVLFPRDKRPTARRVWKIMGFFNTVLGFVRTLIQLWPIIKRNEVTALEFVKQLLYNSALIFVNVFLLLYALMIVFVLFCVFFQFPQSEQASKVTTVVAGVVVLVAIGYAVLRPILVLDASSTYTLTAAIVLFFLLTSRELFDKQSS
jgi:hypothetical protein